MPSAPPPRRRSGTGRDRGALPEVLWHTETPLVRTAPVPLFLLAREVHAHDLTVVITGEGADELFWGYDLFKEVVIRELPRSDPARARSLLEGLYPYLGGSGRRGPAFKRFVLETGAGDDALGSHLTRAAATATVQGVLPAGGRCRGRRRRPRSALRAALPDGFGRWDTLERAAWLEVSTLLEPYLLAAQGDRVAMAHGVEGRFPFLDHRVFDYSAGLAPERKLNGLRDKVALREVATDLLPAGSSAGRSNRTARPKSTPFFGGAPKWVEESLSPEALERTGIWERGPGRRAPAPLPGGARDGGPGGDGLGRHPLDPALAPSVLRRLLPTPIHPKRPSPV